MSRIFMVLSLFALLGAAPASDAPVTFTSYTSQFDAFEARTVGMPPDARVAAFRIEFDNLVPGLYADEDGDRLNRRIAKALVEFPKLRPAFRSVERSFPENLQAAVHNFRRTFPDFSPPMPILLAHELGMRDGGSDYVAGHKVMLFGADVIAQIHHDDSIQPFLEHELFHLEHARYFADCDQLWCPLWQEGLATYAASVMTLGASDHQLLLDQPQPIRAPTDARWGAALCWFAERFDSISRSDADAAFTGGARRPEFPPRFGYYVGYWIARKAARSSKLQRLAHLNDQTGRVAASRALSTLITAAQAPCAVPRPIGPISHEAARPA